MITPTTATLDSWADDQEGPVALHLRQKLLPIEGEGAVIFPPTYADIGYNIDQLTDGTQVCTIDSVGSQANRMEPIFKAAEPGQPENPLARLVPQIDIAYGNDKKISILEAGHRLGDAIVRTSKSEAFDLPRAAREAFQDFLRGDATAIARLAPTSLIFGVWDSRDSQAKLPRIVQSVIRAWDVSEIHRAAQYEPAIDYVGEGLLEEPKNKSEADQRSGRGYRHAPAIWRDDGRTKRVLGGIIVHGGIQRDVTVNLVALRRLKGANAPKLRRYLLGLALIAATNPIDGFLRAGCLLTVDPADHGQWKVVYRHGGRDPVALDSTLARTYGEAAAEAFGKGPNHSVRFDPRMAREDAQKTEKRQAG